MMMETLRSLSDEIESDLAHFKEKVIIENIYNAIKTFEEGTKERER